MHPIPRDADLSVNNLQNPLIKGATLHFDDYLVVFGQISREIDRIYEYAA